MSAMKYSPENTRELKKELARVNIELIVIEHPEHPGYLALTGSTRWSRLVTEDAINQLRSLPDNFIDEDAEVNEYCNHVRDVLSILDR